MSYTCGVCKTICDEAEIHCHPCMQDYDLYCVDENLYVYPQTDDGQIICKSLVDNTDTIVIESDQDTDIAINWRNQKIVNEQHLIEEVRKRPPLWNFKLPLVQRSLQIKKMLWEEISASMDGKMDFITIKKRWKSLSDTFRIHHNNKQHQLSGSPRISRKNSWVHYERMQFLSDVQLESETITNISVAEDHNSDQFNDNTIFDSGSSSSGRGSSNKRPSSSDHEKIIEQLAEVVKQPVTVNVPPIVPPPPMDKAGLFGNLIAAQLREIPLQFVDDIMIKVLQIINTVKRQNNII